MIQLIYTSSLASDDAALLPAFFESSWSHTRGRPVTGMLLCVEGCVMHVIEGDRDAVLDTFSAIERDGFHKEVIVLKIDEIAERDFSTWCIGHRLLHVIDMDKLAADEQLVQASPDEIARRVRAGAVRSLLTTFADGRLDYLRSV